MDFKLEGEFITLQSLLKATGLCDTGGAAKIAIVAGEVTVDGAVDTRRGKKLKQGHVVTYAGQTIRVV